MNVATEGRLVRSARAIDHAYQRPPLVWLIRAVKWLAAWRWRWPAGIAVVVTEWTVLYLTGAIG